MKFYYKKRSFWSRVVRELIWLTGVKYQLSSEKRIKKLLHKKLSSDSIYKLPSIYHRYVSEGSDNDMMIYSLKGSLAELRDQVILYVHGGSYVGEMIIPQLRMLSKIATQTEATTLIPIYPLAPKHTYEAAYDLITRLYKDLLKEKDSSHIHFMGDSAGGGFILAFAEHLKTLSLPQPKNIIMLSPWLDITMSNKHIAQYEDLDTSLSATGLIVSGLAWAGSLDPKSYLVSPIYGDLTGLGRLSVFIGTHEIFYPDCLELDRKLDALGIDHNFFEYKGQGHVFPAMPIREADMAISQIRDIVLKAIG
jgi:acetyl esterase/lipase